MRENSSGLQTFRNETVVHVKCKPKNKKEQRDGRKHVRKLSESYQGAPMDLLYSGGQQEKEGHWLNPSRPYMRVCVWMLYLVLVVKKERREKTEGGDRCI